VNKIIVLSHSGYNVDQRVAAETTGVDVIVGGHTNTLLSNTNERAEGPYPTMVGTTAIVSAYAYGKFLGELNVTFNDAGEIIEAVGEPIITDSNVAEDAAVVARIAEAAAPLEEIRNKIVASTGAPIDGSRDNCRAKECEMGNLVADAMLARVKDQGIQVALANGGGLRASLDEGEVTMGEVYTILPFQNTLATFEVKGATLKDALENAVLQYDDESKNGRFAQVAGMTYTITGSEAFGSRISDVMIAGENGFEPMDPEQVYGVVSNNYVRGGGDGYKMFRGAMNVYDFGPDLADVVSEYLADAGAYKPYLDGRITVK
jgi:5'-nucleotidase